MERLIGGGQLRKLIDIREIADPPQFMVLER